jgi:hypothetical protein
MNYFLVLLVLCMGAGGYYEYTQLQGTIDGDEARIHDLSAQVDKLTAGAASFAEDKDNLMKELSSDNTEVASLRTQLQALKAKAAAAAPAVGDVTQDNPGANVAVPPAYTTHLGTISALDGKTYQDCQLLKVEEDGITFSYTDGITKVPFGLLPPALQTRFGFDPHGISGLTPDQVDAQEEQRKAAAAAGR